MASQSILCPIIYLFFISFKYYFFYFIFHTYRKRDKEKDGGEMNKRGREKIIKKIMHSSTILFFGGLVSNFT
jgi:hypothetical protein